MQGDTDNPFGEYAPELSTGSSAGIKEMSRPDQMTLSAAHGVETLPPDEVESAKYGIGKPIRIVLRGTIAADKDPENSTK